MKVVILVLLVAFIFGFASGVGAYEFHNAVEHWPEGLPFKH